VNPLTVNDTAPALTGLVNAVITGATLAAHIVRPDGTVINRSASIVDGPSGSWSLTLQAGDLTLAGLYLVEIQVTFSSGKIQTFADDSAGRQVCFPVRAEYA
jgi:hypothetical protein